MNHGRIPPCSLEAEQGVLGCIFLDPNNSLSICASQLSEPECFYDLRNQQIFDCLREMWDQHLPIDIITVQDRLKDSGKLDACGGIQYLASLPDGVPSAANLPSYVDLVIAKHSLRKVLRAAVEVAGAVYDQPGDVGAFLDEVETRFLRICESKLGSSFVPTRDATKEAINTIEEYYQRQGAIQGVPTGFIDLDRMTSGLQDGDLIIIAGRPSQGKTSLAMNIAEHVAVDQQLPVGVFSLEMSRKSLMVRMICSRAKVNLRDLRDGILAERDFSKLTLAAGKLSGSTLVIDDTSRSILEVRSCARKMVQQFGIRLIVIDYIQLMSSGDKRKSENRQQEVSDISSGLKLLAKEMRLPVIAISQLNREIDKTRRQPRLSDLRESGSLEQDADLVAMIYSNESENEDGPADVKAVNLLVAKQRNGPTGEIPLTFLKSFTRFESAAKISSQDVEQTANRYPD